MWTQRSAAAGDCCDLACLTCADNNVGYSLVYVVIDMLAYSYHLFTRCVPNKQSLALCLYSHAAFFSGDA